MFRDKRIEMGLDQFDVAAGVGLSIQALSQIENGKHCSDLTARKLCRALKLDPDKVRIDEREVGAFPASAARSTPGIDDVGRFEKVARELVLLWQEGSGLQKQIAEDVISGLLRASLEPAPDPQRNLHLSVQ